MSSTLLRKKLEYWEHQLLDLGKRNRMINYRETKRSTLKLIEPGFDELFRRLAINEETLTFQRPVDRETDIRVFSILSLLEVLSSPLPVTIGDIKTDGSILERQKTLRNMRSKARLGMEEQGTNTLYLSFGFIEWLDGKGASARWIKSPLLLVPVMLTLEALNSPYALSKYEDDIIVNPTLDYYLKTEYGLSLPAFDENCDTLDDYLTSIEEIANQRGWRIVKEVNLGLLSFQKITMYNDLLRNEERISANPVIRAMAGDVDDVNTIPYHLQRFDLDSISTRDSYQVMSADSSQQDAILYSKNNISFVMQGPPGTGKSQTIANIIAEAIADGKKVLFVSEKMAALQVVYRRLQEAHLGDFCLPLHSYKANKREILEQIGANLKLNQTRVKSDALMELDELQGIRQELNRYATELHKSNAELDISCYEAYSRLQAVEEAPTIAFAFAQPLSVSQAQLNGCINRLRAYSLALERIGNQVHGNPWDGLCVRSTGYEASEKVRHELCTLMQQLNAIVHALEAIPELSTLNETIGFSAISELATTARAILALPDVPTEWISAHDTHALLDEATNAKSRHDRMLGLEERIGLVFDERIYGFDTSRWKAEFSALMASLPFISGHAPDFLAESVSEMQAAFARVCEHISAADSAFADINGVLGTNLVTNGKTTEYIADILALLKPNLPILHKWLACDTAQLAAQIIEAKEKARALHEMQAQLLQSWETDVLSLGYAQILARYKTDYTSILKIFNAQYHRDRKQIQALTKTVRGKLSDAEIIDLLQTLKNYHAQKEWLTKRLDEMKDDIGTYSDESRTHWDEWLSAVELATKLKQLPSECVSKRLLELMEGEHKGETDRLEAAHASLMSALSQAKEIIQTIRIDADIFASDFDGRQALSAFEGHRTGLERIAALVDDLRPYLTAKEGASAKTTLKAMDELSEHSRLSAEWAEAASTYGAHFSKGYQGRCTAWNEIIYRLEKLDNIKQRPLFDALLPIVNPNEARREAIKKSFEAAAAAHSVAESAYVWLCSQFTAETFCDIASIALLRQKVERCIHHLPMREGWVDYLEAKEDCQRNHLANFIAKLEDDGQFENIEGSFLKGFYHQWIEAVIDETDSVRRFRRNTQDERIKRFGDLDDKQLLIAQMRIREKLIESLPSEGQLLRATDEISILNKELNKKRNIMPLRKLFRQIPNLLMRLKPCLMMSPLSVSYFLETEAYRFDMVIFDEASQIFPEDAIGAIFRGAQVIIAGDSKQLPPTSFFAATTNSLESDYDNAESDDIDQMVSDSILEETAAVLPNRTLRWHYRSKHEDLIAFSNSEIYGNRLITFPSSTVKAADMGVEYIYVENGYYEGSGKNCNIREAQKCVKLVLEHIKKHPERSLGIIAFSEKQQAAIESAIIDFRERTPEYEWFFDESKEEPFFVKNLENVQGDERDTIIFSVCYAKDINGRMHMRFGPLGQEGGERRLNVAITRAKCNIKLVGSILPSDIDLSRTSAEGVRMLRAYIEFARGRSAALKPVQEDAFEAEDSFCSVVAAFIAKHGYKVQRRVGCSDYKLDIAVLKPDTEGEFIAGIECDGLSYIHAKTARDRDHLRTTVLENMGWQLYRVWSTEWMRNPAAEEKALLAFLRTVSNQGEEAATKQSAEAAQQLTLDDIARETARDSACADTANPYGFDYYEEAKWWEASHSDLADNVTLIKENILHVVRLEQPIHLDLLYKRLGPSFTSRKATTSVKNTIDGVICGSLSGKVAIDGEGFVRLLPATPVKVRIPRQDDEPRSIEYIHTEEIAAAMLTILDRSFGITTDELSSECARVFGFERRGVRIWHKTQNAIRYLHKSGRIRIIDNKVTLT